MYILKSFKQILRFFIIIFILLYCSVQCKPLREKEPHSTGRHATYFVQEDVPSENHFNSEVKKEQTLIPIGLNRLLEAYPEHLESATKNVLIWKDGTRMMYDDGIKEKDFETLLNAPDLQDQMSMEYTAGRNYRIPPLKNADPGRVRYEPFFLKMYGYSQKEVEKHLVTVYWLPSSVNKPLLVTSVNNIHRKFQELSDELDRMPEHLKKYIGNPSGTFTWRTIDGTNRLSPHCFGIAIDINVEYANYWKWEYGDSQARLDYKNLIPLQIVEIFEKHGFIWGGKWYHYDTMHFEYRPELINK